MIAKILGGTTFFTLFASFAVYAEIPPNERAWAVEEGLKIVQEIDSQAKRNRITDRRQSDPFGQAQLVINLNSRSLMSRLVDGFLTMHSTGTSEGSLEPSKRRAIEGAIAGQKFSAQFAAEQGRHLMPKYAYVVFPGLTEMSHFGDYGDIYLIMKPAVKKRTTWSPSDSFDFADLVQKGASRLSLLKKGHINTFSFAKNSGSAKGRYFEAQIWGALDGRSVAEVVFPKEFRPEFWMYPYVEAIFKKLNNMGIAISYFEPVEDPHGIGLSQFPAFIRRVKLPSGQYPNEIRVVSPEEQREDYRKMTGGQDIPMSTKAELEDEDKRRQQLEILLQGTP